MSEQSCDEVVDHCDACGRACADDAVTATVSTSDSDELGLCEQCWPTLILISVGGPHS